MLFGLLIARGKSLWNGTIVSYTDIFLHKTTDIINSLMLGQIQEAQKPQYWTSWLHLQGFQVVKEFIVRPLWGNLNSLWPSNAIQ